MELLVVDDSVELLDLLDRRKLGPNAIRTVRGEGYAAE
jgi:hypothetical protein